MRAKVEHPFHVIKNLFRHRKTRYRGLAKNTAQLFTLFGFANLVLAGRRFTILKPEERPERRKAQRTLQICSKTGRHGPKKRNTILRRGRLRQIPENR